MSWVNLKANMTVLGVVLVLLAATPFQAVALELIKLPNIPASGDFVVGPAKIEISVDPGGESKANFSITNRTGRKQHFVLSVEDFEGSTNPEQTVNLLGSNEGKRSLKNSVVLREKEFDLDHGERVNVPVSVIIPAVTPPGGRFAAVLVSMLPAGSEANSNVGASVVSRVGVLLFVNVIGDAKQDGKLISLKTKNSQFLFWKSEVPIELYFDNRGDTYLNPYGLVETKNIFGKVTDSIILEPWFVLPDSVRLREVVVERTGMFGLYRLQAQVNRGYNDVVDISSLSFLVLPLREILLILAAVTVLIALRKWRRKEKQNV